jgi:hypothetical protein
MKHTKGPWLFCNDGGPDRNIWADTTIVATTEGHWVDCETADYNAYLIAAAPELLEACQEFVKHIKSLGTDTEKCRYLSMALNCRAGELIENAIAKATGEIV